MSAGSLTVYLLSVQLQWEWAPMSRPRGRSRHIQAIVVHRIHIRIRPDIRWIWWIRVGSGSGRIWCWIR